MAKKSGQQTYSLFFLMFFLFFYPLILIRADDTPARYFVFAFPSPEQWRFEFDPPLSRKALTKTVEILQNKYSYDRLGTNDFYIHVLRSGRQVVEETEYIFQNKKVRILQPQKKQSFSYIDVAFFFTTERTSIRERKTYDFGSFIYAFRTDGKGKLNKDGSRIIFPTKIIFAMFGVIYKNKDGRTHSFHLSSFHWNLWFNIDNVKPKINREFAKILTEFSQYASSSDLWMYNSTFGEEYGLKEPKVLKLPYVSGSFVPISSYLAPIQKEIKMNAQVWSVEKGRLGTGIVRD